MTPEEAIRKLDELQSLIVHGSNIYGDIATVIRNQIERYRQLRDALEEIEEIATGVTDGYYPEKTQKIVRIAQNALHSENVESTHPEENLNET